MKKRREFEGTKDYRDQEKQENGKTDLNRRSISEKWKHNSERTTARTHGSLSKTIHSFTIQVMEVPHRGA